METSVSEVMEPVGTHRTSRHHTKTSGDIGVLKAQLDLYCRGFFVSLPMSEHAPFDLVITRDGKSRTVQVKSRRLDRNGTVEVKLSSSWADKRGNHSRRVSPNEVDIYCVFCPDTDLCYYFDPATIRSSIKLRVSTPKNGQVSGVRLADDYREVP